MEEWTKNKYKIGFFNELLQPNHDEKNAVAISEDLLSEDIPSGLSDLAFVRTPALFGFFILFC